MSSTSVAYIELPIHPAKPLTRALIGGWNLNVITSVNTGQPFTVTSGVDNALTGAGGQRADLVSDPYFPGDRNHQAIISQYLNAASFAANAIGTYGVLGRNTFIGPGFANLDLGIVKDFAPQERYKAQLRFEMFNALNHANFTFRRRRGLAEPSCRLRPRAIHAFCSLLCASGSDLPRLSPLAQRVGSVSNRGDNHRNLTRPLTGIIPPSDASGRIATSWTASAFDRLLNYLIEGGSSALFVLGSTGDSHGLSHRLRRE